MTRKTGVRKGKPAASRANILLYGALEQRQEYPNRNSSAKTNRSSGRIITTGTNAGCNSEGVGNETDVLKRRNDLIVLFSRLRLRPFPVAASFDRDCFDEVPIVWPRQSYFPEPR